MKRDCGDVRDQVEQDEDPDRANTNRDDGPVHAIAGLGQRDREREDRDRQQEQGSNQGTGDISQGEAKLAAQARRAFLAAPASLRCPPGSQMLGEAGRGRRGSGASIRQRLRLRAQPSACRLRHEPRRSSGRHRRAREAAPTGRQGQGPRAARVSTKSRGGDCRRRSWDGGSCSRVRAGSRHPRGQPGRPRTRLADRPSIHPRSCHEDPAARADRRTLPAGAPHRSAQGKEQQVEQEAKDYAADEEELVAPSRGQVRAAVAQILLLGRTRSKWRTPLECGGVRVVVTR